ncbi:hypothetical protein RHGRI_004809 [Rhododendron griersonianum]|uniref:Uncharacterized protein n=1 Tax=Rhododendron griersonianum TaxID=479676 RepID=A0AAV6LC54_9ERIC|nr:hypothetical protein RHGRI_004809 [Rhododendron griersonianum]
MEDPLQLAEDEFKKIDKINFMATRYLLKAVGRRMRDHKSGGSIVFLNSLIGAERGLYQGAAAYGSCLAGVQQLVRSEAHLQEMLGGFSEGYGHRPSTAKILLLSAPMSYALPLLLEIGIEEANGEDWVYGSGLGSDADMNALRLLTECSTVTSSYSGVNSAPLNGGGGLAAAGA